MSCSRAQKKKTRIFIHLKKKSLFMKNSLENTFCYERNLYICLHKAKTKAFNVKNVDCFFLIIKPHAFEQQNVLLNCLFMFDQMIRMLFLK